MDFQTLLKPDKIDAAKTLADLERQLKLEKAMKTSALLNVNDDSATLEAVRASARFDKLALLLEHADVAIERFFTWPERWTRDHASDDTQPRLDFAAHHTIAFVFDNGFEYRRDGGVPVPLRAVTLERADRLVLTPFQTPPPSRPQPTTDEDRARARVEATAQATAREAERVALKLVSAACDIAYGPPGVLAAVEGNAAERDARFADGASSSTLRGVELVRVPPSMWPAWRHARFRVRAISAALHTSTAGVAFARLRRVGVDANGTLFYEFDAAPRHHAPSPSSERTVRLPPSVDVPGVARDASVEFALACLCMAALGMVVDAHASPRMAYDAVRPMDARDPPPAHATRLAAGQLTLCVLGKPAAYRDDAVPDGRLDVHVPMGGWRLAPAEAARACDALLDSLRPWLSGVYASSSAPTGDKRNSPLEPATRDARYGSSALRRMWGGKAAAGYDKAPPAPLAPLVPLAAAGKGVGLIGDRYVREGEDKSLSWHEWEELVGAEAAERTVWDTPTLAVKQPSPPESRDGPTTQEQSMYALPLREGARGASDGSAGSLAAAAGAADRLLVKRRQQELALASVDLSDAALERGQTHLGALREALRLADENRAHLVLVQHARPQMAYLDVHPHYKWYLVPTRAGRRPTEREAEATAEAAAAAPSPLGLFVRAKGSSWSVESYSECDPLRSDAALAELDVGARVARVELRHASEPAQGRRVWLVNAQSCHDTFAVEASRRAALLIDCDAAASLLARAKKTFYDAVVAPCGAGAAGPVPDVVVGVFDDWDDVRVKAWTDLREETKYAATYVDRCFAKEDPIADGDLKKTLSALGDGEPTPTGTNTEPPPYQLSTKWLDRLHQHFRQSLLAQEERAIDHAPFRDTRFVSTRRLTAAHGRLLARCSAVGNAPHTRYHVVRTYLAWREARVLLRECFRVVVEAKPDAADAAHAHQVTFRTNYDLESSPGALPTDPRGDVTEAGLMAQLLEDVKSVRQAQNFIQGRNSALIRAVSPEEEARRGVLLDRRTDPLAAHALKLVRDELPYLSATHDGRADKRGKTGASAAGASATDAGRRLLSTDANAHKSSLPACRYPLWKLGRPDAWSVAADDENVVQKFLTDVFSPRAPPAAATPPPSHY